MNSIENTANALLTEFDDNSISTKKVNKIITSDPYLDLRMNLLSFFKDRMQKITSQEKLKERVEQELEAQIERDELSFDQLLRLHSQVSKNNNISVDSFLSIFKPTPGVPSILAENLAQQDDQKDEFDEMYESMSSEQLRKLDKLSKLLEHLSKNTEET